MDLTESLDKAVAALKAPLEPTDREQGWTDDLRREIQEEISVNRSALRRHGHGLAKHLRPASTSGWHTRAYGREASTMW
ncbi:hypothetical protein [Streptomyces sp. NPDC059452]|uniref:hypothetical protein n=1 Tax=Streptomyces sp. NPDC059452 TaxID=3346835 RepID=UPI003676C452